MATSKLQREVGNLLDKSFPQFRIRENYRPDWLVSSNHTLLELDFYIEELKIGIEVQGLQHFQNVPFFFKTREDFAKRLQYDQEKRDLCQGADVELIEVCTFMDACIVVGDIQETLGPGDFLPVVGVERNYSKLSAKLRKKKEWKEKRKQYKKEHPTYRTIDDATPEQKNTEKKQFLKKLKKYGGAGKRPPKFIFNYLTETDVICLMKENGM